MIFFLSFACLQGACTHSGNLQESAPSSLSAMPATVSATPENVKNYWLFETTGDCEGYDLPGTTAGVTPALSHCNAETLGQTAVCWDGDKFKHPEDPETAQCVYKTIHPEGCQAPSMFYNSLGKVYKCVEAVTD